MTIYLTKYFTYPRGTQSGIVKVYSRYVWETVGLYVTAWLLTYSDLFLDEFVLSAGRLKQIVDTGRGVVGWWRLNAAMDGLRRRDEIHDLLSTIIIFWYFR